MAELVRALYYPDFFVDQRTLAKEILLFDELHFMDRPSISFQKGGQFGTIGAFSPLRQFEQSFRESGVPLYVHQPHMGPISDDWYRSVSADVSDSSFMTAFVDGLKHSDVFRNMMIAKGNYGEYGDETAILKAYLSVSKERIDEHGGAIAVFEDDTIRHMDLSHDLGRAKSLVATAVICSAKLNFALAVGANEGFAPLADAKPYTKLLGSKYHRAVRALPQDCKIQITDLSFAILDELLSKQRVETLSIKEAVEYRSTSDDARRAFMEHVGVLQKKYGQIDQDRDYVNAISHIVETEIVPAAREYRNKLKSIDENLVGDLGKGALGAIGGSSLIEIFGDLSMGHILPLAGAVAAYVAKGLIDNILAHRAAARRVQSELFTFSGVATVVVEVLFVRAFRTLTLVRIVLKLPIHLHRHRGIDGLAVFDRGAVVPAADVVYSCVVEAVGAAGLGALSRSPARRTAF